MDPLSAATAFATIISLIGQYRSERSSTGQADFNDFMSWLVEKNHEEVKSLLEQNALAVVGIKELLNEQHRELMEKLELLDKALATYANSIPGFSNLVRGLGGAGAGLSPQALRILEQFESSGASKMMESRTFGGTSLMYLDSNEDIQIDDQRFLEDDLKTLAELNLLRLGYNSQGDDVYIFTRDASQLVRSKNSGACH